VIVTCLQKFGKGDISERPPPKSISTFSTGGGGDEYRSGDYGICGNSSSVYLECDYETDASIVSLTLIRRPRLRIICCTLYAYEIVQRPPYQTLSDQHQKPYLEQPT